LAPSACALRWKEPKQICAKTSDQAKPNGRHPFSTPGSLDSPSPGLPATEDPPLRAVHTPNFPAPLRQLGASQMVTTFQAGKLVVVRDEGDHLNARFRSLQAPMGMSLDGDRLAIGTKSRSVKVVDHAVLRTQAHN